MKKCFSYILLLILITILFNSNSNAQLRAFNGKNISPAELDRFIRMQMDSLGMPGISIALINNNRVVYHRALGVSDIDTKKPVDGASIFEAASMSKTAFTYFVIKMVEKGVLNLDTPLCRYMPYPDIDRDNRYKLITARMVLCHKTGFPNWRYFEKPDSALHVKYGDLWIKFTPGTQFSYSGEGYHYLAQVVAFLNHRNLKTLDALYQQEVSKPLGLTHFNFSGNDYISQHKVSGHVKGKSVGKPWGRAFPDEDSTWFEAAGSLHTEAIDYSRFLIALMEHKGISKASLDEMLKEQVQVPKDSEVFTNDGDTAWGLGIGIIPSPYGTIYEHGGNNGDFQSGFRYIKAEKIGYVFFTNCDQGNIFNNNLTNFLLKQH